MGGKKGPNHIDNWDPMDFVWPRLHAAMQGDLSDPVMDLVEADWDNAVTLYDAYLHQHEWPKSFRLIWACTELTKDTRCLHDSTLVNHAAEGGTYVIVLDQHDGAWDACKYVATIRLHGATLVKSTATAGECYEYEQIAKTDDGYRVFILFSSGEIIVDFKDMDVEVVMKGDSQKAGVDSGS